MRLIGNDDDIVALRVTFAFGHLPVELLDQREDVRLVLGQQSAQMFAARSPAWVAVMVHDAAAGKRLVDLGVEVVSVGKDEESKVAAELPVHLAGERHHRVTLAGPLGVPEDAQLALPRLAVSHRVDGPVDTQELMIAGDDFLRLARRLVEKNEVLHKVHEVALVTDALE